jgi:hypothetical protein
MDLHRGVLQRTKVGGNENLSVISWPAKNVSSLLQDPAYQALNQGFGGSCVILYRKISCMHGFFIYMRDNVYLSLPNRSS